MTTAGLSLLGVNLSGAEFGGTSGKYGWKYTYPTHAEIDYYASKNLNVIRLPFRWERLQPTLGGALDGAELSRIKNIVAYAAGKGISVVLDPHDFGAYGGNPIGSSAVPNAVFADFWGKLASEFTGSSNVIFGLMNEPHKQTAAAWLDAANAAIAAIRDVGATQEILVPGTHWDGGSTWTTSDNAAVIGTGVVDPLNNYAFEIHQYLDKWSSGTQSSVVSDAIGVQRLQAVTAWAEQHGAKLFLGEFAVAQDATSLAALNNMLGFMSQHTDAWQGATYWGAGPWWGNYMYSIEPAKGVDKPQMAVLESYAPGSTAILPAASSPAVPAPHAPVVTMALKTDSGISASDRLTKVAVLTGQSDPNAVVTVAVTGRTDGKRITADASGMWSLDVSGLRDGAYELTATSSTAGGTGSASLAFNLDRTGPKTSLQMRSGTVNSAATTVTGFGEAGSTLQLFDNGAVLGTPLTVAANGLWSTDVVLPTLGANAISAVATDAAGNTATTGTATLFLDHAPVIVSGGGEANAVYDVSANGTRIATVRATDADPSDHVHYALIDGRQRLVQSGSIFAIDAETGALSFTSAPRPGVYGLRVAAIDDHGAKAVQNVKVNVSPQDQIRGLAGATAQQTFVFDESQHGALIAGFQPADLGSTPHSVLQIAHGLFDHADAGLSGNELTALLASHSSQIGIDTVLFTDKRQSIDLQGVDRQTLLAHPDTVVLT